MHETKYRSRQTTSHSSLLVARQGDVSRKLNQAFLLVDSFNFYFVDEERSDISLIWPMLPTLRHDLTAVIFTIILAMHTELWPGIVCQDLHSIISLVNCYKDSWTTVTCDGCGGEKP